MKKRISTTSAYKMSEDIRNGWDGVIPNSKIELGKKPYNRKKEKEILRRMDY